MKHIKWFLFLFIAASIVSSCGLSSDRGELVGSPGRKAWFHPQPYGTVYIPTGSFHIGTNEQDVPMAMISPNKQVTISAFYMDETEITNNEYRQFIDAVLDSIVREKLGEAFYIQFEDDEQQLNGGVDHGLNYRQKIDYEENLKGNEEINDLFYKGDEVYYRTKQIDVRKLKYRYEYIDLKAAAQYHRAVGYKKSRAEFKKKEEVEIYPDTLVFMRDFTYSYNEPIATVYFWHPKYDDYPLIGVNWRQANAFSQWRTTHLNSFYSDNEENTVTAFRLPTEYEWEYAARGGRDQNLYPWGNYYVRNAKGCALANFKPNRGDYANDGGHYPIRVGSYFPNDYGLYDMSGNVAEWTRSAYAESANLFSHDNNPDFQYDAKEEEPETLKRKVIRGGSWKDVAWFIQCGTRTYEYQDSANSYTGFRCVMSYIGRSNKDKR